MHGLLIKRSAGFGTFCLSFKICLKKKSYFSRSMLKFFNVLLTLIV